ncbi:hypothetical protein HDU96_010961 [Phlyctochytrium bullatum]|nr:hypothetical protein HDU96_010961 [Phlyctochytrium bullatum]
MSRPNSQLPGYVNPDGSDVCLSISSSRACDAWASTTTFLDLSALARATNASQAANGTTTSVAETMLVYDVATFDAWVASASVITKQGAKGYVAGLLRAGGCSDFQPKSTPSPALRYARSFTCARALLTDSTPATAAQARWNATTGQGGGCEANLSRRPPALCKPACEALMDSVVGLLADRTACPAADLSLLPLIKPALFKICADMITAGSACVQGVAEEVVTCGFGTQRIADAVQFCARNPSDSCCSSASITAAATLLPSGAFPTSGGVPTATDGVPSTTADGAGATGTTVGVAGGVGGGSGNNRGAMVAGLVSASVLLVVAVAAGVMMVARRNGWTARDVVSRMTFGWVRPDDDASEEVLNIKSGGRQQFFTSTGTLGRGRGSPMVGAGTSVFAGSGTKGRSGTMRSTKAAMAAVSSPVGTTRNGVPASVWQGSGTIERTGLMTSSAPAAAAEAPAAMGYVNFYPYTHPPTPTDPTLSSQNSGAAVGEGLLYGGAGVGAGADFAASSQGTMSRGTHSTRGSLSRKHPLGGTMTTRTETTAPTMTSSAGTGTMGRGAAATGATGAGSMGRSSTRSMGTLVLRKGESFGPETFRTRWRGVTQYLPRLPDEIEVQAGDYVTLSTFYK